MIAMFILITSGSKSLHSKYQPICLSRFNLNSGVKKGNIAPSSDYNCRSKMTRFERMMVKFAGAVKQVIMCNTVFVRRRNRSDN